MIPRSWGGRSTRRKESSTRAGLFHLSKFPSTSAKWNIDTCIEPREDRISDDDKKRRERKEIFYIWRTLYPGYGGSRTMITRRRTLDCSISRVNRSAPVFRLNSPREMEKPKLCPLSLPLYDLAWLRNDQCTSDQWTMHRPFLLLRS